MVDCRAHWNDGVGEDPALSANSKRLWICLSFLILASIALASVHVHSAWLVICSLVGRCILVQRIQVVSAQAEVALLAPPLTPRIADLPIRSLSYVGHGL